MASVKIVLDQRNKSKNLINPTTGEDKKSYPLKLRIFHKDLFRDIPLNYYFKQTEWIKEDNKVSKTYENSGRVNSSIQRKYSIATTVLADYQHLIEGADIDKIRDFVHKEIELQINPPLTAAVDSLVLSNEFSAEERSLFLEVRGTIEMERKEKTKNFKTSKWYQHGISAIKNFNNGNDIRLIDITVSFLKDFEADHISRGGNKNGVSAYLRAIRSITNSAIKDTLHGKRFKGYPWAGGYSIPSEKTRKRAVTKGVIIKIRNLIVAKTETKGLWNAKNYLFFMFNCMGMNFIDLAKLRRTQIIETTFAGGQLISGRLEYVRSKNGRPFSIKLPHEAIDILNFYNFYELQSDAYVFPIGFEETKKGLEKYEQKRKRLNKYFNLLGEQVEETNLDWSTYTWRHSWASIAKKSGASMALIGEGLGHETEVVTKVYVEELDTDIMDDANEKILAFSQIV